ncbi:MAG: DAK2 domain-containing protein, partial [Dehalococcoidia bacterium]
MPETAPSSNATSSSGSTGRVTARDLLGAFRAAEQWLLANRDGINAINVYPVPDGDTGTNMLLTLRSAIRDLPEDPTHAGDLAAAIARAALLGARGNSGVIASQMLRGFAEALDGAEATDCRGLVAALEGASKTAYA